MMAGAIQVKSNLDEVKIEHVALPKDFQVRCARGIHVFVDLMVCVRLNEERVDSESPVLAEHHHGMRSKRR